MKWLTRFLIAGVFLAGLAGGTLLGIRIERDRFVKMQRNGPRSLVDSAMSRLSSELKTTDEQNRKLRAVLDKALPEITAAENERRAKVLAIMENVKQSASDFLDTMQRQTYETIHQRLKLRLGPATAGQIAESAIPNS